VGVKRRVRGRSERLRRREWCCLLSPRRPWLLYVWQRAVNLNSWVSIHVEIYIVFIYPTFISLNPLRCSAHRICSAQTQCLCWLRATNRWVLRCCCIATSFSTTPPNNCVVQSSASPSTLVHAQRENGRGYCWVTKLFIILADFTPRTNLWLSLC
jgi:hypothetical protein